MLSLSEEVRDEKRSQMHTKTGAVILTTVLLAGGGAALLSGTRGVSAAPAFSRSSGWQTYKDARRGFTVARPAGWTVQADSRSIRVQDPNRRETVLMEVFTASPGDTAEACLNRLAENHAALFPDAEIGDASPQKSKGEEVAASLTYGNGAGRGRALCSIVNGKGLLFVLAAPSDTFAADQPALAHIIKSLRFTVPAAGAASAHGAAAQASAAVRGLHFVSWTEPREHGFHVDIPKGWKADGGVFRFGPSDVRIAYQAMSPAKDMSVLVGDPRLPSAFEAPNQVTMPEGQGNILHAMSALEFNRWYLNRFAGQVLDNLTVGAEHPMEAASRQRTAQLQQQSGGFGQPEASLGVTEFSGRSKESGKRIIAAILSSTQRSTHPFAGGEITTWFASPMIISCNDDAGKARNQPVVMAAFARILQSYRENPAWLNRRRQELGAVSEEITRDGDRRRIDIAKADTDARGAIMGQFWGNVSAQKSADDERQRSFINILSDRTDVGGDGGPTVNVQSGSSHYYRNSRTGDVLGTDSAYSPGVDFTPLTER